MSIFYEIEFAKYILHYQKVNLSTLNGLLIETHKRLKALS